jgi:broad specificity phosphatase PhoE
MKLIEKPFMFIRHGETDFNLQQTAQGQMDVPLNATGIAQAEAAREVLKDHEFVTVCCSPLKRAKHTAQAIVRDRSNQLVVIDDLAECHLGIGQGTHRGEWFDDWRAELATPDGAEPYAEFLARALRGVNQALEHEGPVLIVAHGGIYWSLQRYAPLDDSSSVANAIPLSFEPPQSGDRHWSTTPVSKA